MAFFVKYKLHFNILLLLFWGWVLVSRLMANEVDKIQIIVPIIFLGLSIYNIFVVLKEKQHQ
jgi:hypothetical protein